MTAILEKRGNATLYGLASASGSLQLRTVYTLVGSVY